MDNLVSIITPSYKSENFISQTIESVLNQTYQNWELIIVDDASPDNANKIIEEFCKKDNRIRLIKLEKNSGPAVARNTAIKEAKGRYIAFLDADDMWLPQKLEKQIEFMKKNNFSFTFTYYKKVNRKEKYFSIIKAPLKVNYKMLLRNNYIGCLTAIYDAKILGKVYMPSIRKRQDYGLWLKLLKKVDYAYCLPEVLSIYRIQSESVSSNKLHLLAYNYNLFREIEGFSIIKSLFYVTLNIIYKVVK